jgi:hypothetical protein
MTVKGDKKKAISGKTYSLYGNHEDTDLYYRTIRNLADEFLKRCPDDKRLLSCLQKAGSKRSFLRKRPAGDDDRLLTQFIKKKLRESLMVYTKGVKQHLKTLPFSQRTDSTLRTAEEQYHLYMLEIELVNRVYKEAFKLSSYKFALIAHCLRDFRPDCRSVPGDIESVCRGCTEDCFIRLGSLLLKRYDIHPYISMTMDLEKLFKKIRAEHPEGTGALGIACIPELVNGMRLCIKLDIPPMGIPLDANRCARWMKECRESSFSLRELEGLIR